MLAKDLPTLFPCNRAVYPVVSRLPLGLARKWPVWPARVPFRERHAWIEAPIERRLMSFFIKKISRRAIVQALIAMPALQLFRKLPDSDRPDADPDEIVVVNGWVLKRSDLA